MSYLDKYLPKAESIGAAPAGAAPAASSATSYLDKYLPKTAPAQQGMQPAASKPYFEEQARRIEQGAYEEARPEGGGLSGGAGDVVRGAASGVLRGVGGLARAVQWVAPDQTPLDNVAQQAAEWTDERLQRNPGLFAESKRSVEGRESSPWNVRGWLYPGLESLGMLAPGVATTVVTGNPVAGAAVTGAQFWGDTAQQSYDQAQGLDESERVAYANWKGAAEGGTEALLSFIPFKIARALPKSLQGKLIAKAAGASGKAPLEIGKDIVKTIAAEVPVEMGQEYLGQSADYAYEQRPDMPGFADLAPVIGPTIIMSGLLGTGAAIQANGQRRAIHDALTNPAVPVEVRLRAVDLVEQELRGRDAEMADLWARMAVPQAQRGPVAIDLIQGAADKKQPPAAEVAAPAPAVRGMAPKDPRTEAVEQANRIWTQTAPAVAPAAPVVPAKPAGTLEKAVAKAAPVVAPVGPMGGMAPAVATVPDIEPETVQGGVDGGLSEVRQEARGAQEVPSVRGENVESVPVVRVKDAAPGSITFEVDGRDVTLRHGPGQTREEFTAAVRGVAGLPISQAFQQLSSQFSAVDEAQGQDPLPSPLDAQAHEAASSPENERPFAKATSAKVETPAAVGPVPDYLRKAIQYDVKSIAELQPGHVAGILDTWEGPAARRIADGLKQYRPDLAGAVDKAMAERHPDEAADHVAEAGKKVEPAAAPVAVAPAPTPAKLKHPLLQRQVLAQGAKISKKQPDGSYVVTGKDGAEFRAGSLAEVADHLAGAGKGIEQVPDAGKMVAAGAGSVAEEAVTVKESLTVETQKRVGTETRTDTSGVSRADDTARRTTDPVVTIAGAAVDVKAEKVEPAAEKKPGPAKTKPEADNTVFTEDAYQKARAVMKAKLSQLNAGIDPELMQSGFTIAGYHIEKGSRKFVNYAAAMIEDFGEAIKPYLKSFYNGVRDLPGIDQITGEMDSYQAVAGYDVEKFTPESLRQTLEFEEPKAAENAEKVEPAEEPKAEPEQPAASTEPLFKMSLKETVHAKKGGALFVVTMDERVERELYERLNRDAKRTGAGYSSFRGKGAIPGFQFRDRAAAEAFKAKWSGAQAAAEAPAAVLAANEVQPEGMPYIYTKVDGDWHWRPAGGTVAGPGNRMQNVPLEFQDKLETLLAQKGEAGIIEENPQEDVADDRAVAAADREDGGLGAEGAGAADLQGTEDGREAVDVPGRVRAGDGGVVPASLRGSVDEDSGGVEPAGLRGAGAEPAPGAARDLGTDPGGLAGILRPGAAGDLRIPLGGLTRTGSWKATAARNLDIIELIRALEEQGRPARFDEQQLLMRYTGWGAGEIRNKLFPGYASHGRVMVNWAEADWKPLVERVAELLPAEDLKTAARSSQYAHYTSEAVTRSIWSALQRLGFAGGKVFEPGMGIGNFAGTMPDGVYSASRYTGIEFDNLTAAIAKQLYPAQNIVHGDYTKQKFPNNFFDLAIGNPPFAQTTILTDPDYKKHKFSLHDYFFAKTIDKVRPGGLLAFVTSRYTLDKQGDKARQYLAERADLVGAIRLPQTAFKQNAGTEVVTDVIFLRKRLEGEAPAGEAWGGLGEIKVGGTSQLINEYFVNHPEMVLGTHSTEGTQYAAESYTVKPLEGDIEQQFAEAVLRLPANIYSVARQPAKVLKELVVERDFNPKHKKEGGVYLSDSGELMRVEFGSGVALESMAKLSAKDKVWLKDYVGLRDLLKQARFDQFTDGTWEKSLKALNRAYDAFVKQHGRIKDFTLTERKEVDEDGVESRVEYRRFKWQRLLKHDVEGPLLEALEAVTEDGEIVKAQFLRERTVAKPLRREPQSMGDALALSLDEVGMLDLDHVAGVMKVSRSEAIEALADLVFESPEGRFELADEYLSGDVVTKLAEAEAAANSDEKYRRNVKALLEVQPKPLTPGQISAGLGMAWIPPEVVEEFADEVLGLSGVGVSRHAATNTWKLAMGAAPGGGYRRRGGKKPGVQSLRSATSEWGTAERGANEILDAVLNQRPIKITVTDSDKKTHVDAAATARVNEIADKMRTAFRSWIWTDAERAGELLELYNKKYNNLAPRRFDGSHLTLPGIATKYQLHAHQKRAIWRMIQTGNTYLAHAVGAGKTLEMIAAGMEMKRLGLISKPLYVVPNDQLSQWAAEFMDAYPMANVMVADEENFHTGNRRRFLAQAAMNAPDAIIITQSALGKLRMKPESVAPVKEKMLAALREALAEAKDDDAPRHLISKMEKMVEQAEQRFDSIVEDGKGDNVLTFEDLGVDFLFVDEAHAFRKLDFTTVQQIKGVDPTGSRKALDLFLKTSWLNHRRPGRSHVFASGTPVTNTMGELYNVMRFFAEEQMERDDIAHFDAWAAMFGQAAVDYELNAAGRYEPVTRFAKFNNLPELMTRVRSFMDVLTSSNLSAFVKRPDLKGGAPENIVAPASEALKAYQETVLQPRMEATRKWKPSKAQPGNPDPIINIITDGRLSSIDMRYVGGKNDPNSKLNRVIDEIIRIHKLTKDSAFLDKDGKPAALKGAAQVVFYNHGFGKDVAKNRGFDARAWINQRLKAAGIPASEVAWFDEFDTGAKQLSVLKEVREGKRRIIIGHARALGVGKNLQNRLYALHYIDPPWYPADVEQPHGRIIRQGNQHGEVVINWYATKGSYDSTMWQMVGRKGRFIEQAFMGDASLRSMEDISEVSQYEMARALSSGDERIIKLVGLQAEVERLSRLKEAHYQGQAQMRSERSSAEWAVSTYRKQIARLKAAEKAVGKYVTSLDLRGQVGKIGYSKPGEFGEAVVAGFNGAMQELQGAELDQTTPEVERQYGSINGLPLVARLRLDPMSSRPRGANLIRVTEKVEQELDELLMYPAGTDGAGLARRIINRLNDVATSRARQEANLEEQEGKLKVLAKKIGAPFEHEQAFSEAIAELAQLQAELTAEGEAVKTDGPVAAESDGAGSPKFSIREEGIDPVAIDLLSGENLWRQANEFYREHLQGRTVNNPHVGEIGFTGRGRTKALSVGRNDARRMSIVLGLDALVKRGVVVGEEVDRKGRDDIGRYLKLVAPVQLGDEVYAVTLVVREDIEGGKKFYTFAGYEMEPSAIDRGFDGDAVRPQGSLDSTSVTIAQLIEAVKGQPAFARGGSGVVALGDVEFDAIFERITVGMVNRDGFVVVPTAAALPASILAEIKKQGNRPDQIDGVFHGGKVYLVRENIASAARLEEVLFHEWHGHAGLYAMFGNDGRRLKTEMAKLYDLVGAKRLFPLGRRHGINLMPYGHALAKAGYNLETRKAIMMEEMLAHLTKEYSRGPLAKRIREVLGQIRAWLRDHGFAALSQWGEADIAWLLKRARVYAEAGAWVKGNAPVAINGEEILARLREAGISDEMLRQLVGAPKFAGDGGVEVELGSAEDIKFSLRQAAEDKAAALKTFRRRVDGEALKIIFGDLAGVVPEKVKMAFGSVLSNPHYSAKKSRYRQAAYDLNLKRTDNANEIKHEVMATQGDYEGAEGVYRHLKGATKAEKADLDKLLVQGDIDGVEYAETDLDGDASPLGRPVAERVKKAYFAFRQTIARATEVMFDRLGRLRLLPYEGTEFYQELVDLLDEKLSSEEVAQRFGIHEKAVEAYQQIVQSRKKLDELLKPYRDMAWSSNLREALLKGISGIQMQQEFSKSPELLDAFREIRQKHKGEFASAEKYRSAQWVKILDELLARGDEHPMLQKLELYNAYKGAQAYDSQLAEFKAEWRKLKGYLPRIRKDGEWHVKIKRVYEDGTFIEVGMLPTRTRVGATLLVRDIKGHLQDYIPGSFEAGAQYEVWSERNKATPEEIFMGLGSHRAIEALLSKTFDKANDAGIIENPMEVQRKVLEILAEEISARGFARHRIGRAEHLIEGYQTENTPAMLLQFVGGMAGWLSKGEFAMRANKLMSAGAEMSQEDQTWVKEYVDDALRNSTYLDQWMGTMRSVAALMFLGFKASSAMLNATQNYIWGQALLSKQTSGATRKLLQAQYDVVREKLLVKAGKPSSLTEDETWALDQALRHGRTQANYVRAMAGMDDTGGAMGKVQGGIRWMTEKSMIPFQAVETYWNREPALLAAYRVFRSEKGMEREAALKEAERFVDDVHFVVGKENIPALLRKMGPLGRTLYTFQSYTHNYLLGMLTSLSKGEFQVVVRSLTALVLFGGLAALPFGDDLDKWYRRIFGERPLRMLEQWLRETSGEYTDFGDQVADFVLHGAPALGGVNFSNAIGVNIPWFSPEDESLAERVVGVWGGLAQKVRFSSMAAARGDGYRAVEFMAPEALANILRAYRLYADGTTTLSGRPVFGDDGKQVRYTAKEALVRSFGFMPLEPSKQTQARWDAQRARDYWSERKGDVLARVRIATDRKAALAEIQAFNRALRAAPGGVLVPPITLASLRQAMRAKADKRELAYRNQ